MKTVVLSIHQPIEKDKMTFSKDLNLNPEQIDYLSIFELKHTHSLKNIIKKVFSLRSSSVVLNLKGENTDYLEYILYCFALIAFQYNYTIVHQDRIERIHIITLIFRCFGIIKYTALNYFNLVKCFLILTFLKPKPVPINFNQIKNILYLKTNMWFGIKAGGSIGHISGVVNSLQKHYKVQYVTCESPIMIDEKVEIIDLNKSTKVRFAAPYELNQLQLTGMFFKFIKKLKLKPDCIYQRITIYNFSGALASRLFRIPLIIEYNGSEVWIQSNWSQGLKFPKLALMIENFCLLQASKIITISNVLEKELLARGLPKQIISTYPNCIDPKKYNYTNHTSETTIAIRKSLGLNESNKVFTFIGTFGAWHGVEFLAHSIKAYIDQNKSLDKNLKFLLIGNGNLFPNVQQILADKKYADHVILTGVIPQAEAPKYLYASDVFLSPHIKRDGEEFFGSPTKLFEYMAFKKPIIASSLNQIGEIFDQPLRATELKIAKASQNYDSILFEPNSQEQFLQCIQFCLDEQNQNILKNISENSYRKVMQDYTWDVHVEQIIK